MTPTDSNDLGWKNRNIKVIPKEQAIKPAKRVKKPAEEEPPATEERKPRRSRDQVELPPRPAFLFGGPVETRATTAEPSRRTERWGDAVGIRERQREEKRERERAERHPRRYGPEGGGRWRGEDIARRDTDDRPVDRLHTYGGSRSVEAGSARRDFKKQGYGKKRPAGGKGKDGFRPEGGFRRKFDKDGNPLPERGFKPPAGDERPPRGEGGFRRPSRDGDRPRDDRPRGDRPWKKPFRDERPAGDRPRDERSRDERPRGDRPWKKPFRDERPGPKAGFKKPFRDERPRPDAGGAPRDRERRFERKADRFLGGDRAPRGRKDDDDGGSPYSAARGVHPLARAISRSGLLSRADAERAILAGRVTIDGETLRDPSFPAEPDDRILVDGNPLPASRPHGHYYAFHKPAGVITTTKEEPNAKGAPVVGDFFRDLKERVFPCGRLDRDSEGLLLVTSDPRFLDRVTSPEAGIEKEYRVAVDAPVDDDTLEAMRRGVALEEGLVVRPKALEREVSPDGHPQRDRLVVVLTEGKNREIRRMFERFNIKVNRLVRVRIGGLSLGRLKRGSRRDLSPDEVDALMGEA